MPMRGPFVAAAGLAAVALAGCGSGGEGAQHDPLPGLTSKQLAGLRASALGAAVRMGEPRPTGGIVVATTQHAVFRAEPDGPKVDTPDFKVFVVAFAGKLTAFDASRPSGGHAPTGRFAYAIHRADTLAVTDTALLAKPLDLAALGPHVRLDFDRAEWQRAIAYAEMYLHAGNPPPVDYRVSSATRGPRGLWRVEIAARPPGARVRYSCFTIRLDRFFVRTSPTDEVTSRGIEGRSRRCPR